MKIVVVTAMPPDEIERRGRLPAQVQVLAKPVAFGDLQGVVRDLLMRQAAMP